MRKMKNYFKTVVFLLGISLLLWNCDNDSEIIDDSNHLNSKVKMIHQNFNFIKNNSTLLNKLNSLSKSKNKNVSPKSIEVNDFTVFTDNVTYTSYTDNETKHTYSFYIKRKVALPNNTVENLILKYEDGFYKSYILKYYFPQGIYSANESFELIDVEEIDDLSDSILARGCYNTYEYIAIETKHDCFSGEHSGAGEQGECNYESAGGSPPYSTWSIQVVVNYVCDGGESGGGGLGGGTGSDTGGPSGGSTPPDNPSTTIDTGITLPACQTVDCGDEVSTANQINSLLGDSLNDQQLIWLFNNPIEADSIFTFINTNNSSEAKNFANEVIDAAITNDYSKLYNLDIFNQDLYDVWKNLSQKEKDLIKSFPMEAWNIFKNREIAENATKSIFGFNGLNDKSDAYRHAYYNAINTKKVGAYMAELFSNAHESEVPIALLLEKEMDLFNNSIGHKSNINYPISTITELEEKIHQELLNGNLKYLSPLDFSLSPRYDSNGDGIQDCTTCKDGIISSTKLIPTNQ